MVTIDDIVTRCMNLSTKYHHGPEHTRDLVELAKVVMTFCQDRLGTTATPSPKSDDRWEATMTVAEVNATYEACEQQHRTPYTPPQKSKPA